MKQQSNITPFQHSDIHTYTDTIMTWLH